MFKPPFNYAKLGASQDRTLKPEDLDKDNFEIQQLNQESRECHKTLLTFLYDRPEGKKGLTNMDRYIMELEDKEKQRCQAQKPRGFKSASYKATSPTQSCSNKSNSTKSVQKPWEILGFTGGSAKSCRGKVR